MMYRGLQCNMTCKHNVLYGFSSLVGGEPTIVTLLTEGQSTVLFWGTFKILK